MQHTGENRKRTQFVQLAEPRTEAVLERLRILGNLANPYAYDFTEDDVSQILHAIRSEVDRVEMRFQQKLRTRARFRLAPVAAEHADARGVVLLKREDRAEGYLDSVDDPVASAERLLNDPVRDSVRRQSLIIDPMGIERIPVVGHERSEVEIRYRPAPGWYVRAKDKGHRLGYVLHLYGPDSVEHARRTTGRGTVRADAVKAAGEMIHEAFNAEQGVQLSFTAV